MLAGAPEGVVRGLGALYSEMIAPARPVRSAFLAGLLKPFDAAANLNAQSAQPPNLRWLAAYSRLEPVSQLLSIAHTAQPLSFANSL